MKQFTRTKEDFVCEHCGVHVDGTGYTNHCPGCLWSKHVDVNPGDRAAQCMGMMEPIRVEQKRHEHVIVHRCLKCGLLKKNRAAGNDDFKIILQIARASAANSAS
jgi:rubrerythrin